MNKHRHKKTRCCAHCGQPFIVNPRVGKRHRFCTKPACAEVSRNLARKKWLRNNGGREYYDLSDRIDRVGTWRKKNPKYWRRRTRVRRRQCNDYVLSKRLAAALRYVALQDMIDTHLALKIGMISELSGCALQDTIAKEIRRLMLRGYAILRGQSVRPSK